MTTAQLRKSALEAERLLLWNSAARLWEMAIAAYPHSNGQLAELDISRMQERAASCRAEARELFVFEGKDDPFALPDAEVFQLTAREVAECDEVADNMATTRPLSFDEALAIVNRQMPHETYTIRSNVAEALSHRTITEALLALQKAIIELEYAHSKMGNDRSLTRALVIAEAKRAIANAKRIR